MTEPAPVFFPTPQWKPSVLQPLDRLAARFAPLVKNGRDFVLFAHGTCVVIERGLPEGVAHEAGRTILQQVVIQKPDMRPAQLPSGDVIVRYNLPAASLLLDDVARANWLQIEALHMDALLPDEVLIMPTGPNTFDDFAKKVLFARCFLFMDAEAMQVDRVVRPFGFAADPTREQP